MSEKVSKSRISPLFYVALAALALIGGFYVTSNFQNWKFPISFSASSRVHSKAAVQSTDQTAKEYAAYKQVFVEKVKAYKEYISKGNAAIAIRLINERMVWLSSIEAQYIKLKPGAVEPDRIKLRRMIGDYSRVLEDVTKLDYELSLVRDARSEVTNAHSILLLTSPELYAQDRDEVKKILKDADEGTFNIYQAGMVLARVKRLTEIALYRMKPEHQEATPEMWREAGMLAVELYLNELTVKNNPVQKARE